MRMLGFGSARGFLQGDFEVVAQVRAPVDVGAATPSAEDVAEDVAEGVGKAAETGTCCASAGGVHAGMAVLVVGGAFAGVAEYFVGFLRLLEVLFRFWIIRIAVRMMLHRQLAIGLFEVLLGSIAIDPEHFVIVAFRHCQFFVDSFTARSLPCFRE